MLLASEAASALISGNEPPKTKRLFPARFGDGDQRGQVLVPLWLYPCFDK